MNWYDKRGCARKTSSLICLSTNLHNMLYLYTLPFPSLPFPSLPFPLSIFLPLPDILPLPTFLPPPNLYCPDDLHLLSLPPPFLSSLRLSPPSTQHPLSLYPTSFHLITSFTLSPSSLSLSTNPKKIPSRKINRPTPPLPSLPFTYFRANPRKSFL